MPSPDKSMADLASSIRNEFRRCTTYSQLMTGNWAELRMSDFNLWVDGVGATARNKASLDARLQVLPNELLTLQHLLSSLCNSLKDCQVLHGTALHASKEIVDMIIENLAMLASVIRRTGRKSRLRRADDDFDPTRQRELRRHLECIVLLRPTEDGVFRPRSHSSGEEDEKCPWSDMMPTGDFSPTEKSRLTTLQSRLIDANLRRRYRFLRAQRHAVKLSGQPQQSVPVGLEPQTLALRSSPVESDDLTPGQDALSAPKEILCPEPKGIPHLEAAMEPARSSTKASTVNTKPNEVESHSRIQVPGIAMTRITEITATTQYPSLWKPSNSDLEMPRIIKCPCCCQALPAFTTEGNWKKHLAGDLYPYTCIAEGCPTPNILYLTRQQVTEHMQADHAPTRWSCPICGDVSTIYSELEALVNHMQDVHANVLPVGTIEAAIRWGAVTSYGITSCPLCNSSGPLDDPELINHVLKHTHDFALRALPWPKVTPLTSTVAGTYDLSHPTTNAVQEWLLNGVDDEVESRESPGSLELSPYDNLIHQLVDECGGVDYFATNDYFAESADGTPPSRSTLDSSVTSSFHPNIQLDPFCGNLQRDPRRDLRRDLIGMGTVYETEIPILPLEFNTQLNEELSGQEELDRSALSGPQLMALRGQGIPDSLDILSKTCSSSLDCLSDSVEPRTPKSPISSARR